jgi:hypothetical protein
MSGHHSFTEPAYAQTVDPAREKYRFNGSDLACAAPVTCWHRDLDFSPHRAVALDRLESKHRLRCVYHIAPSGRYLNVLEPETADKRRKISALSYKFSLHFDIDVFRTGAVHDNVFLERVRRKDVIIEAVTRQANVSFYRDVIKRAGWFDSIRDQISLNDPQ